MPAMRLLAATALMSCLIVAGAAVGQQTQSKGENVLKAADIRAVAPALENYEQTVMKGELWKRPGLSVRDRSIATLAVLITRSQTAALPEYFNFALDNGVKPSEVSEILTHLAFYAGWGNAMEAVAIAKDVFGARKIA